MFRKKVLKAFKDLAWKKQIRLDQELIWNDGKSELPTKGESIKLSYAYHGVRDTLLFTAQELTEFMTGQEWEIRRKIEQALDSLIASRKAASPKS